MNFENKTFQHIETYRKTDKRGNFYHTEKWVDTTYNSEKVEFTHTTVVSGRCSKQDFERRMERSIFLKKSENHIIF